MAGFVWAMLHLVPISNAPLPAGVASFIPLSFKPFPFFESAAGIVAAL